MNNSIKRAQSQARLSFAERENFRPKVRQYKKLMMTLALLLTAATGAWAQTTFGVKEITADMVPADWSVSGSIVTPEDLADMGINFVGITEAQASTWADYPTTGHVYLLHAYTTSFQSVDWNNGNPSESSSSTAYTRQDIYNLIVDLDYRVFVTVEPIVTWDATTKTATFTQPGSDVVLTPLYAPTAAWAEVETVKQLPAAAEGVIAGTDDPLIVEGTVAKAGETEAMQGTVMYAVTPATVTDATELTSSDWKNTVPTAKTIADDGAEVKVWYYIQGADAPDGVAATLDNTFNNSEVSSLTVTVLSNKFDLTLNPANANTIDATDASKGTVTVNGTDKTTDITEGKLQGVKMGSEVKLKAKAGYKFRKVEVKKAASTPTLKDALKDGAVTRIKFNFDGSLYADFTYSNGSFTRTGGSSGFGFSGNWTMKEENGVLTMTADYNEMNTQWIYFVCTFYVDTNEYTAKSTGSWDISFSGIEVNGKDITDQLTKVK